MEIDVNICKIVLWTWFLFISLFYPSLSKHYSIYLDWGCCFRKL